MLSTVITITLRNYYTRLREIYSSIYKFSMTHPLLIVTQISMLSIYLFYIRVLIMTISRSFHAYEKIKIEIINSSTPINWYKNEKRATVQRICLSFHSRESKIKTSNFLNPTVITQWDIHKFLPDTPIQTRHILLVQDAQDTATLQQGRKDCWSLAEVSDPRSMAGSVEGCPA